MFNASMTFDLGEDANALREMVHRWAQERVKPLAAKRWARDQERKLDNGTFGLEEKRGIR